MNTALVFRLMVKDWYLVRLPLFCIAAAGALSVALLFRGGMTGLAGIITALIALIMLSILVPQLTVMNERKQQNLAFVMSLPISPAEYTMSKVLGNLSAFVVLWVAIAGTMLGLIASVPDRGGVIPLGVVAALAPFVSFSLLLFVAIVSESELWTMLTMGASNVAYSFGWFGLTQVPNLLKDLGSPEAVWSTPMLAMVATQLAVIVLAFAATFYFQSRKRSFV